MAAESSLRDFRDLKLIGKGSFGRVYRCIRISDGGDYAMKEVAIKAMSQREREDAVNEVRILASVHHQMVIRSSPAPQSFLLPPRLTILRRAGAARRGGTLPSVQRNVPSACELCKCVMEL
jgi:serine/threonine protein kinase